MLISLITSLTVYHFNKLHKNKIIIFLSNFKCIFLYKKCSLSVCHASYPRVKIHAQKLFQHMDCIWYHVTFLYIVSYRLFLSIDEIYPP